MSDEAPHHDAIDIIGIDRDGGHYVYWVNRLTADDLHSKADIAAVLAWYRHQLAVVRAHDQDGERWRKLVALATQWPQTVLVVNINIGHDWHTADTPEQIAEVIDAAIAAEGE